MTKLIFSLLLTLLSFLSPLSSAIFTPPSTNTFYPQQPQQPQQQPSTTTTATPASQFLTSLSHTLSRLNFHDLAIASYSLSLSSDSHLPWLTNRPITIFAPFDTSLHACPSCSLPRVLQEHAVPGLYPYDYVKTLSFGKKLETVSPGRCVTITSTGNGTRFFVNGAEITRPDMFVSDYVIVHGVRGYITHRSEYSCLTEKITALSLPHSSTASVFTRMMLADVMIRLKTSGYTILTLAIRVKHAELVKLDNMTIFAVDDGTIFNGGYAYVHSVRYHIVPNQILRIGDLERLPVSTVLPTLDSGETLTVTTPGGVSGLNPMRINYVKIRNPDLICNSRIVVHGIPHPFPHLRQNVRLPTGRSGFYPITSGAFGSSDERVATATITTTGGVNYHDNAPSPRGVKPMVYVDDEGIHQGL